MVAAPVGLFAGLLWMANKRADAEVERHDEPEDRSAQDRP